MVEQMRTNQDGFTLLELLAVMVIIVLATSAVTLSLRPGSGPSGLKASAQQAAAYFRTARAGAINKRVENVVIIDTRRRQIRSKNAVKPLEISSSINLVITAADNERRAGDIVGIRFFPNGSSTGGTLLLKRDQLGYEIRVNWLTGHVSVKPYS